uniref:Helicase C-terminal domain-containing protein n=1 Tax=Noctiluca scintillans TaxID=2966 RepID=A0A7S1ADS9_NOCSC
MILGQVRPDRQVCLFSATWPDSVGALAQDVCHDRPIKINVGSTKLSACRTIHQNFWLVGSGGPPVQYPGESKDQVLLRAVEKLSDKSAKALIFCNSKDSVFRVVANLCENGYNAEGFCGGYTQEQREATIAKFSDLDSDLRLLVCTMVLGRGHDFKNLKYVLNYDLPCTTSGTRNGMVEYVHRIGRTGRAGEQGYSLTLLEESDLFQARELIDLLKESRQEVPQLLTEADTKRKRQKYWRMRWDPLHATGHPSPDALVGVEESWSGRGTGRRHEFLKECGGLGAARTVAPGTS